jgi:hypothetical protein
MPMINPVLLLLLPASAPGGALLEPVPGGAEVGADADVAGTGGVLGVVVIAS